jgi:hypothetical protein
MGSGHPVPVGDLAMLLIAGFSVAFIGWAHVREVAALPRQPCRPPLRPTVQQAGPT